jgi:hypothetical protein
MRLLVLQFLWKLFTGELWHIWQEHEQRKAAQAVADSPSTLKDLEQEQEHGRL